MFLLQKYLSLCPSDLLENGLFLNPLKSVVPDATCWYRRKFLGHNTLKTMVKVLTDEAGIGSRGKFSNHSLRASTATRLFRDGVDEQLIAEQTGHRSTSALRRYKRADSNLKQTVSDIIQGNIPDTSQSGVGVNAQSSTVVAVDSRAIH